jgi:hypothetical protein
MRVAAEAVWVGGAFVQSADARVVEQAVRAGDDSPVCRGRS